MKQLILLGLLISLGVAATVTVTPQGVCGCSQLAYINDCNTMPGCTWNGASCSTADCTTFTLQSKCLEASKYCQWNMDGTCSTFSGCENIVIASPANYLQCAQTNARCLGFDGTSCQQLGSPTFTTACADYKQAYCPKNVGTDGVCVWNTTTCIPITQCTQATSPDQCQKLNDANGLSCQYLAGVCTQITSCAAFGTQEICKYYFPSLTSPNMILCQWNTQNQCVSATNSLYLNNGTTCLAGTGYNYRWLPTAGNPTVGVCATCKSVQIPTVTLLSRTQCQCSQYVLQTDCNTTYCQWNQATSSCGNIACANITSQSLCMSIQGCYYDFTNKGGCVAFAQGATCANLPLQKSSEICAAQNIYCPGFVGGVCTGASTLQPCAQQQGEEACTSWAGSDGVCKWTNGVCTPLQNCAQITDSVYCGSWQNLCSWNSAAQLCQQLTCASYNTNQGKCVYVLTGFQQSQYQLCRYNVGMNTCENAYSGLTLTSKTCATSTASTYRWSTTQTNVGMCVSCGSNTLQLQTSTSCQCAQLSETDCGRSGYCLYNNGCTAQPCTNIVNQLTCASLTSCYWNATTGCTVFTGCANLTATSQLECVAQNASCKGFTGGVCSNAPTQTCTQLATAGTSCANSIGTDGVCLPNGTTCTGFTTCTGASQALCEKYPLACYWNTTNAAAPVCQAQTCSNYTSQLNCKFFVPSPISTQVVPCNWNANNKCVVASEVLTQLNSSTCVSNTHSTYRWIPSKSETKGSGYCVKCQQQITSKNQCPCSFLVSQNDCSQALECFWANNSCQAYTCPQIYLQSVCASQASCAWINGTCTAFSNSCSTLLGANQLQCISQQTSCVGSNGTTCTNILTPCEQNTTATGCVEQFGSNGACFWDSDATACYGYTSCGLLSASYCKLKSSACYVNQTNQKCMALTCAAQYANTGNCTYILNVSSQTRVQTCYLNGGNCMPTTDSFELTEQNCFANSARTSRWIPIKIPNTNTTGICQACSRSLVPTYNIAKCQCYQFITENDCTNPANSCSWSTATGCLPTVCSDILAQSKCALTEGCAWTITDNNVGTCGNFVACSSVTGTTLSIQNCLAYSAKCRGYNGATCTQNPQAACNTFAQANCNDNIGTDGLCIYNTTKTACEAIGSCAAITNANVCSFYTNACSWANGACATVTCQNLSTPATCGYAITNIATGAIQLCQWNSATRSCSNLNTFKNQNYSNCATSSAFTYRWIPKSKTENEEGYCTSCVITQVYAPGQCSCNQLFSQAECQQNSTCDWTGTSCYNVACSSIVSQYICSTNPRCSWSAAIDRCQPFTSCSDLSGVNAGECFSYSSYCGSITGSRLTNLKYACAAPTTNECAGISHPPSTTTAPATPTECENTIVQGGICQWITTGTTPACTKITMCSQITSQYKCLNFPHTCYWNPTATETTGACQQTTCANLQKVNCNYLFAGLGTPSGSNITYCQWSPANNACATAVSVQSASLTQANCYVNSMMMYRWTSTSATSGYCASCSQYAASYTFKTFCGCKLLSQTECGLATPQCTWTGSACAEVSDCTAVKNQTACASLPQCQWTGSCVAFNACSAITTATSALACIQTSIKCPVYTAGSATPCSAPTACSSQGTSEACSNYNNSVAAGYCYWNPNTSKCQQINNCGQILDVSLCGLQTNRCSWSAVLNACVTQTCSSYTSQTNCQYIFTSYVPGEIALCQWNTVTNDCRSAPLSAAATYADPNCFVNTGHTYHMDGTTCVQCFQKILAALFVILLILV